MASRPQSETNSPNPSINDLEWLNGTLFSSGLGTIGARSHTDEATMAWTALPLRGVTRRLVPTARRFAPTAFANKHDAMSSARLVAGRMAQLPVRTGMLRFAPQLRADEGAVLRDPTTSIIAMATAESDLSVAACAITLGPRRYNRKPVIQLIGHNAETVAFLKVGADEATSAMVATEARALSSFGPSAAVLEVPRVLWSGSWQGRSAVCVSPVGIGSTELVPATTARLIQVAKAVIESNGGQIDGKVRESGPVERLRQLAASQEASAELELVRRVEQIFGETTVTSAVWHGDFSPWNMISDAGRTGLIDWEFSQERMPVGADLLHHRIMVATHLHDRPIEQPLTELTMSADNVAELHAMGVPTSQHRSHLVLYLLELIRRDVELERSGLLATGFGRPAQAAASQLLATARG